MGPEMNKQYIGNFKRNRRVQHVTVETFGNTITRILVSSDPDSLWFTLEEINPELTETDQSHRYDRTNKLHVNALILAFAVITNQSDDDVKNKKWHASISQPWPSDERLILEPAY